VGDIGALVDTCDYLFLSGIEELDYNGLRVVIIEGRPAGPAPPLRVGDAQISGGTRIAVTGESRAFEIVWQQYVAYSVLNESFAAPDGEGEQYDGKRFRVYSKSRFIEYVSRASFASDEYPGPTVHYRVACEDHVIDVIATRPPAIGRLR
jgi:hypothetical protein